tara:strand:+ start:431 stop:1213 length:783 start_codon:yes stop_codon:yes gene_type:complete
MSIYQGYITSVKNNLQISSDMWYFKSDPAYNFVLEHVNQEQGEQYLNLIKEEFPDLYENNIEKIKQLIEDNDKWGKPNVSQFTIGNSAIKCSPTNLRYIYHSFLILGHMKECGQNNPDIIEIGGGYGGLCYYLYNLSNLFDIEIKSYSVFDIYEICILQKKYLQNFNININAYRVNDFQLKENSFLISNYAFSELPEDLRDEYSKFLINRFTSHGFLAWNAIDLYDFVEASITSYEERPSTGNKNKFVYFGPCLKQNNNP